MKYEACQTLAILGEYVLSLGGEKGGGEEGSSAGTLPFGEGQKGVDCTLTAT